MKPEYVYPISADNRMRSYRNIDDALAAVRQSEGRAQIRFVVTLNNAEQQYVNQRKAARERFEELAERYGRCCLDCGGEKGLLVDHIHPLRRGGDSYIENLQILCRVCNMKKGMRIINYRPHPFHSNATFCSYKPCRQYTPYFEMMVTRSDGLRTPVCDDCWSILMADPEIRDWNSPEEVIYPRMA